jgi:hypothetical protein
MSLMVMQYPLQDPRDWQRFGRLSLLDRVNLAIRNRKFHRRAKSRNGVDLTEVKRGKTELAGNDIVLLCIVKNAARYMPSFLAHYRKLGVKRFAFVDDRSDDATRAVLLRHDDVDLYESNVNFSGAGGGLLWRDMLVDIYGRMRWYVSIDSDEYLIYPGCEERPLSAFIADLTRHGITRSLAVMLDIYPDGPLGQAPAHLPPEASPTVVSPLYDTTGYSIVKDKFCTAVRGGPRARVFGAEMRLTKFPVIFLDAETQFSGGSHHGALPIHRNFSAVHAILLHYKFSDATVEEFTAIAARGTHFNKSFFYRSILNHDRFGGDADLRYPGSTAFEGSQKLVDAGFMQDLRDT